MKKRFLMNVSTIIEADNEEEANKIFMDIIENKHVEVKSKKITFVDNLDNWKAGLKSVTEHFEKLEKLPIGETDNAF
jgi:hypothetical protein